MAKLFEQLKRRAGLLGLNFACMIIAWLFGALGMSVWWIIVGSSICYMHFRRKLNYSSMESVFAGVKTDEQEAVMAGLGELPSWVFFPDMERCEWFNRVIEKLWPHVGKYGEQYVIRIIEPALQRSLPVSFAKVNMGEVAVRVGGVKVYKDQVARGELILDMELLYAGDAQIELRMGPAIAGVKDIQLRGMLRVICKPLVDEMPFVGGITAYFLRTPVIDFSLTNLAGALDLPGVAESIRKVIHELVNHLFVLPNKFALTLIPTYPYEIKFTEPDGVLRLHVREARNLEKKDFNLFGRGSSDPYCIVRVGAQEFRTKVIQSTITPVWDEWFEFIVNHAASQSVEFDVYDEDPGSEDDFLGRCSVDIVNIAREGCTEKEQQWVPLRDCKHGEIRIEAYWMAICADRKQHALIDSAASMSNTAGPLLGTCLLMLYVDSAQALPLANNFPTEPCAFVQISCGTNGWDGEDNTAPKLTHKTSTRPTTCNPVWEEQKTFIVNNPRTQHVMLEIMDEKSGQRLGYVNFAVATLMDKIDMQLSAPMPLQGNNAGADSRLHMRFKLRMLSCIEQQQRDRQSSLERKLKRAAAVPEALQTAVAKSAKIVKNFIFVQKHQSTKQPK